MKRSVRAAVVRAGTYFEGIGLSDKPLVVAECQFRRKEPNPDV